MPTAAKKKKSWSDIRLLIERHAVLPGIAARAGVLLALALCLFILIPGTATADTGDRVFVISSLANLRSGPGTRYPTVLKLKKDRALIEVERKGNWVMVATGRTDIKLGWINASLVSTTKGGKKAPARAAPAPPRKPTKKKAAHKQTPDGPLFTLFRQAFQEFNTRFKKETGRDCFTRITNPARGVVQLTINENWAKLKRAQRQKAMNDIFAIWNAAEGDVPITVNIIEKDGLRLMSRFRD